MVSGFRVIAGGAVEGNASEAKLSDGCKDVSDALICFTKGTGILTPLGERRIERLRPGDLVQTLDDGLQPIKWIGSHSVRAGGALAPVRFGRGVIGNHRDLLVSPRHRMLCGGDATLAAFGEGEVLAPAKSLVDDFRVSRVYGGMVTYVHMLFERHQVVIANGAASESFLPEGAGLEALSEPARVALAAELTDIENYGPPSRAVLTAQQAGFLAIA